MHSAAKVTIAIPTYNRAELLRVSLASALAQEYPDVRVLVLDNASTDHTEAVVRSFDDPRVTYVRNETNIGLYGNWCKAVRLNESPYLTILQDDDVLLPGFVAESVQALDDHPTAGFTAVRYHYIDKDGGQNFESQKLYITDELPVGLVCGLDFLHQLLLGRKLIVQFSTVMLRASAVDAIGSFDIPHSSFNLDLNLYFRLAQRHDIFFIGQELAQIRVHPAQSSNPLFYSSSGIGPMAVVSDYVDAVAYLLQSERADDPAYRRWLAERLLGLNVARSARTAELLPQLNLSWAERLDLAVRDLSEVLPVDGDVVLVDDGTFGLAEVGGRRARPFLEREGIYWGPPEDSETAIRELERMRAEGASFVAFGWPAFWWLDHYAELREHLEATYPRMLKNSLLVAYDLRQPLSGARD